MLMAAGIVNKQKDGIKLLKKIIANGSALTKFMEIVDNQKGNVNQIREPKLLPRAKYKKDINSPFRGFVKKVEARIIGQSTMLLGAGRMKKGDDIDLSVGIVLRKKIGDWVNEKEPLATVYYNDKKKYDLIKDSILKAFHTTDKRPEGKPLILKVIS